MRALVSCTVVVALLGALAVSAGSAQKPDRKSRNLGRLRHVVLLKFKDGTSPEQVKKIEAAFRELPAKVPEIVAFEWGTNESVEPFSEGFTHCFLVTFRDAKGRDAYLPHPAHQEFGATLKPHLEKVLVVDYTVRD